MKKIMYLLVFVLMSFSVFGQTWVDDPNNCPTVAQSQECSGSDVVCGLSGGITYCYDPSSISAPGSSSTTTSDVTGSFNGGYLIDCESFDGTEPHCDNNGNAWCDRNSGCYSTLNRETICTANQFGDYSCGDCRGNYFQCDGGGSSDDCEILGGSSCGSGTGTVEYGECFSTSAGNCTRVSDYLDCDNDDSDNDQLTCNGPNGCEVNPYSTNCASGDNNRLTDCTTCICDANYYDCDGTGPDAGNGCEVLDGSSCTVGGASGTYDGPSCTCVPDKSNFETGTFASYLVDIGEGAMLWFKNLGTGPTINATDKNDVSFIVNTSGAYWNNSDLTEGTSGGGTGDITSVVAGNALTGGGTSGDVTLNHQDTSSQLDSNNAGRTYIQDILLDTYGHITSITTAEETVTDTTCDGDSCDVSNTGTLDGYEGADLLPTNVSVLHANNPSDSIVPLEVDSDGFLKLFTTMEITGASDTTCDGSSCSIANTGTLDGYEASALLDDTTRSDEEIEDVLGAMVSGNTETRISVTYQDADGTFDFVVDDMNDNDPEAGDVHWSDLTDDGTFTDGQYCTYDSTNSRIDCDSSAGSSSDVPEIVHIYEGTAMNVYSDSGATDYETYSFSLTSSEVSEYLEISVTGLMRSAADGTLTMDIVTREPSGTYVQKMSETILDGVSDNDEHYRSHTYTYIIQPTVGEQTNGMDVRIGMSATTVNSVEVAGYQNHQVVVKKW